MGVTRRKAAAFAAALAVLAGGVQIPSSQQTPYAIAAQAADTGSRIRVDINKNDGRKASYSKNANNWILEEGSAPTYKVGNVTFKLSNGGSVGGNVTGANNKKLQLQSGIYPRLTMDGAKIKDGDNGGVLKLEISGLSNGNHSLQMWHCNTDGYDQSGDSKNGSLLWVEITDHTGTRGTENVYLPLFETGDGKTEGDGICDSG